MSYLISVNDGQNKSDSLSTWQFDFSPTHLARSREAGADRADGPDWTIMAVSHAADDDGDDESIT